MSNAERESAHQSGQAVTPDQVGQSMVGSIIRPMVASSETRIVKTPGICGGSARVNGTRVSVWGIEVQRRSGASKESIVRAYALCIADVGAAFSYADANRAEIDSEIKANEDD